MSKYKVLYIDDDASEHGLAQIEPMIDTLEESGRFSITPFQSGPFDKISKVLSNVINDYDAIIFDYQLDDRANDEGEKGNVKAPVLAQHFRTEITAEEKGLRDLPFILCSTDDKLQKSYTTDHTSHDLFDLRFRKDKDDLLQVSDWVVALIEGYETLRISADFKVLLNTDIRTLDERIFTRFLDQKIKIPAHEFARRILKDLIYVNGPLIDESTFAARLGVDIGLSEDWNTLKNEVFKKALYTGAFSSGWSRWWMHIINDRFAEVTGQNLASFDANDRVKFISEATGLKKLVVPQRIEGCSSFRYWTICKSYNRPLDPREGFRAVAKVEPKPWQEYSFISKHGAINRVNFDEGLNIHQLDHERYRLTIEQLKNG